MASAPSPDLELAFQRFIGIIFEHKASSTPKIDPSLATLMSLYVSIDNPNAPLQPGVDERYTLDIPTDGSHATLKATTLYGALNGLQTFSQLVIFNYTTHSYQIPNSPWNIFDYPRYSHRGMLVDTARHFQPTRVLKHVIDSLSYAKFNVFHWHVVDSQSFPFESASNPMLWKGSYSEYERYTQDDIKDIVEYARLRNVRVLIEFDTPGHAASWCAGYPGICPSLSCREPLNPSTEATFTLLDQLFGECTGGKVGGGLFPDNMIHLGGDEVNTACWTSTPSVNNWLKSKNFTADQAYYYFVNRVFDIVIAQNREPINWEEVYNHFGKQLNKKAIVHAWYDKATVAKAVADGYRALNSAGWYLDHLADDWTAYYNNDPAAGVPASQQKLVLGGETCMWGETVDPSDIFNTIWPRAAAVAERLWSAASVTDTKAALPRYQYFKCLLHTRGVGAAPVANKDARQPPPGPGSCYAQ